MKHIRTTAIVVVLIAALSIRESNAGIETCRSFVCAAELAIAAGASVPKEDPFRQRFDYIYEHLYSARPTIAMRYLAAEDVDEFLDIIKWSGRDGNADEALALANSAQEDLWVAAGLVEVASIYVNQGKWESGKMLLNEAESRMAALPASEGPHLIRSIQLLIRNWAKVGDLNHAALLLAPDLSPFRHLLASQFRVGPRAGKQQKYLGGIEFLFDLARTYHFSDDKIAELLLSYCAISGAADDLAMSAVWLAGRARNNDARALFERAAKTPAPNQYRNPILVASKMTDIGWNEDANTIVASSWRRWMAETPPSMRESLLSGVGKIYAQTGTIEEVYAVLNLIDNPLRKIVIAGDLADTLFRYGFTAYGHSLDHEAENWARKYMGAGNPGFWLARNRAQRGDVEGVIKLLNFLQRDGVVDRPAMSAILGSFRSGGTAKNPELGSLIRMLAAESVTARDFTYVVAAAIHALQNQDYDLARQIVDNALSIVPPHQLTNEEASSLVLLTDVAELVNIDVSNIFNFLSTLNNRTYNEIADKLFLRSNLDKAWPWDVTQSLTLAVRIPDSKRRTLALARVASRFSAH